MRARINVISVTHKTKMLVKKKKKLQMIKIIYEWKVKILKLLCGLLETIVLDIMLVNDNNYYYCYDLRFVWYTIATVPTQ